ncbi:MAG: nucleoside deaminase [Micavibrio sp.]|nr:MAG: nucleoside deaminase [Micavibrio sp.]
MPDNREAFMRRALDLSFEKMRELRTAPFAAVIVKDGKIIAEGWSEVTVKNDPTAHAEINAIRKACAAGGYHRLRGCEIYCSTEPCPMCLAAAYLAGISKIYYANSHEEAEEFGFPHQEIAAEIAMDRKERIMPSIRMMESEAYIALQEWRDQYASSGGYDEN